MNENNEWEYNDGYIGDLVYDRELCQLGRVVDRFNVGDQIWFRIRLESGQVVPCRNQTVILVERATPADRATTRLWLGEHNV